LRARLDLCKTKAFDGVDTDNVDGYNNDAGYTNTSADQIKFNRRLVQEAHLRGLGLGLKNDPEQAVQVKGTGNQEPFSGSRKISSAN
jgi:hypothetical protein